jgi:hypothetical protein
MSLIVIGAGALVYILIIVLILRVLGSNRIGDEE